MRFVLLLAVVLVLSRPASGHNAVYAAPDCSYGGSLQRIEALDTLTVKFKLCAPDAAFLSKIASPAFGIHSAARLQAAGGDVRALSLAPIGTGPYTLESWILGEEIVLRRSENYWGEAARQPVIIIKWNASPAARLRALREGSADGIDNPAPVDYAAIEADAALALYRRAGMNVMYLGINNRFPPFDNLLVRQALAYGIDKQRLATQVYPAGTSVASQFIPPGIFGFTAETEPVPFDRAMARQLLQESGVPLPIEAALTLRDTVTSYLPNPNETAAALQADLAEIGVRLNVEILDSRTFLDAVDRGQVALYLLGWEAGYPDASSFLDPHFAASASDQFGDKDVALVDLLAQAGRVAAPDARLALYARANARIRDVVPMIPLVHRGSSAAFKATISGAYASENRAEPFALMQNPAADSLVWLQDGEPAGLYCASETARESLRVCQQITETLFVYDTGTGAPIPHLAAAWQANQDLTEWVFTLREGVYFSDGTALDANAVVLSFAVQWDASHPLRPVPNNSFPHFQKLFGAFINTVTSGN